MPSDFSVVAIVAAYNEADIIEHVVTDLIEQGIRVYFIDDGSTDGTVAAVEPYLGRGVLAVERITHPATNGEPTGFEWERILLRKTQLATELDASWFIHHDADEFRESPWSYLSLKDAIRRVDALGFNAIDFAGLDFWPVHDRFRAGDDVRAEFTHYAELAPYDRLQIRCWKKTAELDLASSGGHDAQFPDRKVFPVRFILRHYPIRGQTHGERKIFRERRDRFIERERDRGWHVQYDNVQEGASFIRDPATLTSYDPDAVRVALTLRHRGIEELERTVDAGRLELERCQEDLATTRAGLEARRVELEAYRAEIDVRGIALGALRAELEVREAELRAHRMEASALRNTIRNRETDLVGAHAEIARLVDALGKRGAEIDRWRSAVDDLVRRLYAFERSLSWRWTAPVRTLYRVFRKSSW
jgi:hypothetical protein